VWYSLDDSRFTNTTFLKSWQKVIDDFGGKSHFHGIDLLNEPRGLAEWSNNPSYSWNEFVTQTVATLDYDGIYYIEGVDWGRDFSGMKDYPINGQTDRIIYSPHIYGPSVTRGNQDITPDHLHALWDDEFGYLVNEKRAVVIGEFGGLYNGADKEWQDTFVEYLKYLRIPGIYWSLNPDSADTGGLLLDDWTTPDTGKLKLLAHLQPYPTIRKRTLLRGKP
jgi:endoglucanase